jgi:phosphomannomutase
MAAPIKFGTDGWRAIIADDFTVDNVRRVAEATGRYLVNTGATQVVVGHDCRFAGKLFADNTARVLGSLGLKVILADNIFVSTPMISLAVVKTGSDLGVIITASHNPPTYNGFKLKSKMGGPSLPAEIEAVENLIPEACNLTLLSLEDMKAQGLLTYLDMEQMYYDHVMAGFDIKMIRNSGIKVAYDAMYGAGQRIMQRILPDMIKIRCEYNPSFYGQAPEPIHRNLTPLVEAILDNPDVQLGIANDGDADRIGLYDGEGNFVDSHHILLLLLMYQHKYKGESGHVAFTFSVTDKLAVMAEKYGMTYEITKIGFKYIAEIMAEKDVIVGGEESGGLAVKGHIPERDGVWIGLMVLEFMAKTGKSLKQLIQEVYDEVGSFAFDRDDLHLTEAKKQEIVSNCKSGAYTAFGDYKVLRIDSVDGFKFVLSDTEWVMMRASGTEPVLRVYAQSPTLAGARAILDATQATIL